MGPKPGALLRILFNNKAHSSSDFPKPDAIFEGMELFLYVQDLCPYSTKLNGLYVIMDEMY